jgi:uncharacterized protein YjbJ (UPF0337 family)
MAKSSASKTRAKGKLDELAGKAKAAVGKAMGNEQMQAEGRARQLKGKTTQEVVKAGERVRGAVEEVAGRAKKKLGTLIENEQMQAEGALTQLKGKTRQRVNK